MSTVSETAKPLARPISRGRAFRRSRIGRFLTRSPFYFLVILIFVHRLLRVLRRRGILAGKKQFSRGFEVRGLHCAYREEHQ